MSLCRFDLDEHLVHPTQRRPVHIERPSRAVLSTMRPPRSAGHGTDDDASPYYMCSRRSTGSTKPGRYRCWDRHRESMLSFQLKNVQAAVATVSDEDAAVGCY
jgi:hypothetical protein